MSIFQTEEQAEQQKEHATMINDCTKRESRLSQWESGFIQSLNEQIAHEEFIALSPLQAERLEVIWNKVTN